MLRTPFGRFNPDQKEFTYTSTHKCPYDSEGFHIDFPLYVHMKCWDVKEPSGWSFSVHNEEDSNQKVYLDEETLKSVRTEGKLRISLAAEFLRTEGELDV